MKIDTNNIVSITQANQNFSQVVKKVEQNGSVIILKNNKPKYIISKFQEKIEDEEILKVSNKILNKHKKVFEVLGNG